MWQRCRSDQCGTEHGTGVKSYLVHASARGVSGLEVLLEIAQHEGRSWLGSAQRQ